MEKTFQDLTISDDGLCDVGSYSSSETESCPHPQAREGEVPGSINMSGLGIALNNDTEETGALHTPEVFYTATPGYSAHLETPGRLDPTTKYGRVLQEQKLLVAKEVEANWSGRGQHVEFRADESIPLEFEKMIGFSGTALVESVRCRRIRLARKSIACNRRIKLEDLVQEVSYLHKLRHPHIIQLVGTYLQKKTFAILLYPVATGDLAKFLEEWQPDEKGCYRDNSPWRKKQIDLGRFFFCLAHALCYMHDQGIRHMDIKPSNILVHERRSFERPTVRSVYLADFGISREFTKDEGSQTEGPSSMTRRWCSPEVAAQEPRGRAADIFSLGCVFLEMYTALVQESSIAFEEFRAQDGNGDAFHLTLPRVREWMRKLQDKLVSLPDFDSVPPSKSGPFLDLLGDMMAEDPKSRPTSAQVVTRLTSVKIYGVKGYQYAWKEYAWSCCKASPEVYRVAEEDEILEHFRFDAETSKR